MMSEANNYLNDAERTCIQGVFIVLLPPDRSHKLRKVSCGLIIRGLYGVRLAQRRAYL